ncbi:SDR family oxidoreductase [Aquimarina sp. 2201CG5-10]|uniref:SDR family oxidoreductase n=1 Tax=Aquimarina callyspongiae TaxID=3098150 RepID=UPI002AB3D5FE|nr:SDR family oxidoreductase [Aquimarina sp. 2201CG5-10]MDY8135846.1 SDR family oxidoreductase [Aquimarina sp. 2201CG5-10]
MKHILILGAKSDIGKALAEIYAQNGYHLILAGREIEVLSQFKTSIEEKQGVSVQLVHFDALKYDTHQSFFSNLKTKPFGIICCVGYLGNQQLAQQDPKEAKRIIDTNYTGCVHILDICATYLEQVGDGFIMGISSVAGERGRKSNYFYGSAKAGFTTYLSGLRARFVNKGVHVITVKPGFVNTKMIAHLETPKLLSIEPERLASIVFKAQQHKRNVVYVGWKWKYIMWLIRSIPEFIFKKTNL